MPTGRSWSHTLSLLKRQLFGARSRDFPDRDKLLALAAATVVLEKERGARTAKRSRPGVGELDLTEDLAEDVIACLSFWSWHWRSPFCMLRFSRIVGPRGLSRAKRREAGPDDPVRRSAVRFDGPSTTLNDVWALSLGPDPQWSRDLALRDAAARAATTTLKGGI